jgi:hypothetical protein
MIKVPADLFDQLNIGDPWPPKLAFARRLLVTMELTNGDITAARAAWDAHVRALRRPARVTVATALVQLKELGFVRSFDAVEGGFAVELVKEAA